MRYVDTTVYEAHHWTGDMDEFVRFAAANGVSYYTSPAGVFVQGDVLWQQRLHEGDWVVVHPRGGVRIYTPEAFIDHFTPFEPTERAL